MNTVRNFRDMDQALKNHDSFTHRSYVGHKEHDGMYNLYHHSTRIARLCADGSISIFDPSHYSSTTSRFQARIIRNAMSDKGRWQLTELMRGEDREQNIANMMPVAMVH